MARKKSYWLLKSEPGSYSWDDMLDAGDDYWDGVRNYQARNNMRAMKKGDQGFFYHSVGNRTVVGVIEVTREAYQDPTTDDERWSVVNIKPIAEMKTPVTLKEIKANPDLADIALVRQSRLSVGPLSKEAFDTIKAMGGGVKKIKAQTRK
ncbi:EVE domain-containing protein [Planctomycetota bacterium]|nr:EVE domain-containing protein [Planctomycetota bacterium]